MATGVDSFLKSPCKDCNERVVGCHSICMKYLDYKIKRAENSRLRAVEANKDWIAISNIEHTKKRTGRKR